MKMNAYENVREDVIRTYEAIMTCKDGYHRDHKARLMRTVSILMDERPSGRLLELGSSGLFPIMLKELAPYLEVTVTHFDMTAVGKKTTTYDLCGQSITVPSYSLNLEEDCINANDETFDIILCCEVLEHMERDPMFLLSEINRLLKIGGLLILTTPNITSARALMKILSGREPYFFMQYNTNGDMYRHNFEYSVPLLEQVLSAAGFSGRIWSEDLFEDGLPSFVDMLRGFGFGVEQPGDNIIAVCRKKSEVVTRFPSGLYV